MEGLCDCVDRLVLAVNSDAVLEPDASVLSAIDMINSDAADEDIDTEGEPTPQQKKIPWALPRELQLRKIGRCDPLPGWKPRLALFSERQRSK